MTEFPELGAAGSATHFEPIALSDESTVVAEFVPDDSKETATRARPSSKRRSSSCSRARPTSTCRSPAPPRWSPTCAPSSKR